MTRRVPAGAGFVLLCLIWGSTWLAIKFGVAAVPTFLSAALRFAIASALLLVASVALRRKAPRSRTEWAATVSIGFVLFTGNYGLVYWGEANGVPSGLSAVLYATMPLMTALAAQVGLRSEPLTVQKLLGIGIAFAGVAVIFRSELELAGPGLLLPMAAVVLASACGGVATVAMKRWTHDLDALTFNGIAMAVGVAGLATLSLATGETWSAPSWPDGLAPILYLALIGSVVAFVTYKWLLTRMEATSASLLTLITPIVALFLGSVLGRETIEPLDAVGTAVTLLGIYISLSRRLASRTRSPRLEAAPSQSDGK